MKQKLSANFSLHQSRMLPGLIFGSIKVKLQNTDSWIDLQHVPVPIDQALAFNPIGVRWEQNCAPKCILVVEKHSIFQVSGAIGVVMCWDDEI